MGDKGNDGANERGDGGSATSDGEEHKDQDDSPVLLHNGRVLAIKRGREQTTEDFLSIEGVDGDEVKNGESDVHGN